VSVQILLDWPRSTAHSFASQTFSEMQWSAFRKPESIKIVAAQGQFAIAYT
jgi:hypothetical protein